MGRSRREPDEVTAPIDRYNDAWNAQDLDAVASMHDPDIVFENHTAGERAEGAAAVREHIAQIFRNNPTLSRARTSTRPRTGRASSDKTGAAAMLSP